jgi:hypothetical protein
MRKFLCPELNEAGKAFWDSGDWSVLQKAITECRAKNEKIAAGFQDLSQRLDQGESPERVRHWAEKNLLAPLGLQVPDREAAAT